MSETKDILDEYFERLCDEISEAEQDMVQEYVDTLNEDDMVALEIAVSNLGSSFDITKCCGYVKWKSQQK